MSIRSPITLPSHTRTLKPSSSSLFVVHRISSRMMAKGRFMRNTFPASLMLSSEYCCLIYQYIYPLELYEQGHDFHDEISGNTTTMIPMCLAMTRTWMSKKQRTTVRILRLNPNFVQSSKFFNLCHYFHTIKRIYVPSHPCYSRTALYIAAKLEL